MARSVAAGLLVIAASMASPGGPAPRLVWSGGEVNLLGAPSSDGRFLSHVDRATRNVALRDVAAGSSRMLTRRVEGSEEFAYFSAPSRDGRQVAYAWFNDEQFYELRVVDVDGGATRVVYRNDEAGFVQPCAWTADGKQILTLLFRRDNTSQITLVPAAGGPARVLRSLNWVYPKRMDLSPDGQSIVYDSFAADGATRALYLLSVDGAQERRLTAGNANDLFPLWTPDGKRVVFASDRGGTMGIWDLAVENGSARGDPRLLVPDAGRVLPLGITASGDLFYGVRSGSTDVFVMPLNALASEARRATLRYPGRNSAPAWSPDGQRLAYLSRRGSENFGEDAHAIVIRDLDSDAERDLTTKLAHIERVGWAGAKALGVSGSDGRGRGGLFLVDVAGSALKPIVAEPGGPFRGYDAAWTAEAVYYVRGKELRSREFASGRDESLLEADGLRHVAASPDGKRVAVATADAVSILSTSGGAPRTIRFAGLTELAWGRELIGARGAELWRIPETGKPEKIQSPGNRRPGFSIHPGGTQIALTAGNEKAEVWVLRLGQ
jgi:Tol biopolymer transport system component